MVIYSENVYFHLTVVSLLNRNSEKLKSIEDITEIQSLCLEGSFFTRFTPIVNKQVEGFCLLNCKYFWSSMEDFVSVSQINNIFGSHPVLLSNILE